VIRPTCQPSQAELPSPSDPIAISLGPIDLRWYAIFILCGIIIGTAVAAWLARRRGQEETFLLDAAPVVVLLAVVGARVYYVALEWRFFLDHPDRIVGLQLRGLTIHGALVGGIACFGWLCRRRGEPFLRWADTIICGVPIGQAIGRWGNWANQEAFGGPSDLPWAVEIDPQRLPARFADSPSFHPTHLYESISSVVIAIVLICVVLRWSRQPGWRDGYALGLYLVLYGAVRWAIESLRIDSLYIGPWPAAYWLSGALIAAGLGLVLIVRRQEVGGGQQP
jgi:phosphatidylglycerol:prolipoprotein diacylglycerol transferase